MKMTMRTILLILLPAVVSGSWISENGTRQWEESPWYGWYFVESENWILHTLHGWQYTESNDEDSVWLFDQDLGWCWTSRSIYPWTYMHGMNDWLLYLDQTDGPRWYFNEARGWLAAWSLSDEPSFLLPESLTGTFENTRDGVPVTESYSGDGTYTRTFTSSGISYTISGTYAYTPYQGLKIADVEIVYTDYTLSGQGIAFSGTPKQFAASVGEAVPERFELLYRFSNSRTIEVSGTLIYTNNSSVTLPESVFVLPE